MHVHKYTLAGNMIEKQKPIGKIITFPIRTGFQGLKDKHIGLYFGLLTKETILYFHIPIPSRAINLYAVIILLRTPF